MSQSLKVSGYILLRGGCTFSAGYGFWKRIGWFQPGMNVSVNWLVGRRHLGNRNRFRSKSQVNTIFSPLMTFQLPPYNRGNGLYEEINPFYLGNSGAVYSNYKSSLTVGTSFVAMPKGISQNIATSRNRSQQLIFAELRIGIDSVRNVTINLYEDFLFTDSGVGQALADNWDRYYTGGSSLQIRFSPFMRAKLFAETYTGTTYRDRFDNPNMVEFAGKGAGDTTNLYPSKDARLRRNKRYATQEPGQKVLNVGRIIGCVEFANNSLTHQVYAGLQGGSLPMFFQDVIHSTITIDKAIYGYPTDTLIVADNRGKKHLDRYHRFKPNYYKSWLIIGLGTTARVN
ncbi:hypothetical protein [Spirosoma arcticum]